MSYRPEPLVPAFGLGQDGASASEKAKSIRLGSPSHTHRGCGALLPIGNLVGFVLHLFAHDVEVRVLAQHGLRPLLQERGSAYEKWSSRIPLRSAASIHQMEFWRR